MDKHLKALAPVHINTKFIKLDAEVSKQNSVDFIIVKLELTKPDFSHRMHHFLWRNWQSRHCLVLFYSGEISVHQFSPLDSKYP